MPSLQRGTSIDSQVLRGVRNYAYGAAPFAAFGGAL